jgi:hypothetical protein
MRNIYQFLVEKSKWNKSLERHRCSWEDNIRMDVKEIRCEGEDWIHLAQDRVQWRVPVNTVMTLRVP